MTWSEVKCPWLASGLRDVTVDNDTTEGMARIAIDVSSEAALQLVEPRISVRAAGDVRPRVIASTPLCVQLLETLCTAVIPNEAKPGLFWGADGSDDTHDAASLNAIEEPVSEIKTCLGAVDTSRPRDPH